MKVAILGYHKKLYLIQVHKWATRLEATEMIIHKNGSVTLLCPDGYICNEYKPTATELYKKHTN